MEQRLLSGRAQHQHFAAQVLEVPDVLVQAFRRHVIAGDTQYRQIDRLFGLVGAGHAVGQAFQGVERCDVESTVFQLVLQRLAGQFVVFQYRHASSHQWWAGQVFGIVAGLGQAEADPEFRTLSRRAVDADLSAHLFDQALGNHQPQTGATRLPRQRIVGLTEGLEQRAYVLVRQTDAGVLNTDAQLHTVFVFVFEHGPGDDGAFAGELDRVAHEVGEDLLEPQRIAHQRQRCVAVDQAHQFQLLGVGGGGEDGQGVLQQVAQVERNMVEHQFAGLDFREVENLVDDPQQVVG